MAIRYPSEFSSSSPATDYIKIQFLRRDYKSEEVQYIAEGQTIILNMPQKITENLNQNFANSSLGELGILNGFSNRQGINTPGGAFGAALFRAAENTALSGALEMMNKLGASQLTENGILSGVAGIVFNPQLEVLYEGPDFRKFNFQFSLLTKSSDDARAIKSIVDEFRFRSLPSTGGGGGTSGTGLGNVFATVGGLAAGAAAGQAAGQGITSAVLGAITKTGFDPQQSITTLAGGIASGAGFGAAAAATSMDLLFSGDSRFIKQPPFVYLQYMRGASRHPFIPSLMPASLNAVNFDFTPTGNYTQLSNYAEASGKTLATTVGVTITLQLTEVTNLFQEGLEDNYQPRAPKIVTKSIAPPGPAGQSTSPAQTLIQPAGPGPTQPSLGLPGV